MGSACRLNRVLPKSQDREPQNQQQTAHDSRCPHDLVRLWNGIPELNEPHAATQFASTLDLCLARGDIDLNARQLLLSKARTSGVAST